MGEHPIEGLMVTAMESIKEMIDVNTIIGEPIETSNNVVIIPISKVGFGFASGGSEFKSEAVNGYIKNNDKEEVQYKLPFGGGSGAGVSISPVAFIVINNDNVKLLPVEHSSSIDKIMDYLPDLIEKTNCLANKTIEAVKESNSSGNSKKSKETKKSKCCKNKIKKNKNQDEDIEYDETITDEMLENDGMYDVYDDDDMYDD